MAGAQVMKRIPRIKFPPRHPTPAGSLPKQQIPTSAGEAQHAYKSDVPAPPTNTAFGGKASLQPKRTPVSDKEIESILVLGRLLLILRWVWWDPILMFAVML
ncbi:hypothetical protein Taro_007255 [Colocasia esculenta]|uniref:Uncharacterized protein n=1 Tax=Colocasia esculenta TaxID=4460 RepID=A0A843TZR6_COLES|nr:hypothetical protein [Colocasia esculenta]